MNGGGSPGSTMWCFRLRLIPVPTKITFILWALDFVFFTRVTGPAPAAVTMAERKGTMKVQDGGGEQR